MFMCSVLSYGQLNPTFVFYYYTVIYKIHNNVCKQGNI